MRWFVSLLLLLTGAVSAAAPQTQTFTDDLGRTVTVPLHPQRIVSMHDLDITIPLIELGAPPIASHGRTRPDGSHYLRASAQLTGVDFDNSDIRFIGTADIDLEAVAAAKPDLIITEPSRHVSVEQLEKIAPHSLCWAQCSVSASRHPRQCCRVRRQRSWSTERCTV